VRSYMTEAVRNFHRIHKEMYADPGPPIGRWHGPERPPEWCQHSFGGPCWGKVTPQRFVSSTTPDPGINVTHCEGHVNWYAPSPDDPRNWYIKNPADDMSEERYP